MSRENYEVIRVTLWMGIVGLSIGLVILYHKFRRPLPLRAKLTLFLAALVCIKSAIFPCWCWSIESVPIVDEVMAVGIVHLFYFGPLALIALVASAFQREIRWVGISLSLGYVVFSSPVLVSG